jgi:hypothetical protein
MIEKIQDNLDIIPAGPKPPDPAKLLNSARCEEIVEQVRSIPGYDIVLWDAPPCLMLADPILLGEKLDGILFLVGLGKVSRDLAPQACRRIKATGVDVLGLICNQVNFPSRLNDYGYEYGYYYHYAYAGAYGRSSRSYGSYGEGLKGYIKGQIKSYRDTYMPQANGDSSSVRSPNATAGNLYMGDGYSRPGYEDASLRDDAESSVDAGADRARSTRAHRGSPTDQGSHPAEEAPRSGLRGWMANRLPFGRGGGSTSRDASQQDKGTNGTSADADARSKDDL